MKSVFINLSAGNETYDIVDVTESVQKDKKMMQVNLIAHLESLDVEDRTEIFAALWQNLPIKLRAQLLMQCRVAPEGPDEVVDKAFAFEVADTFGSDWAQAWYRFIVLVTKLA